LCGVHARLPPTFPETRDALHAVAEHVLAPARHRVDGHIGLRVTIDGFGTPEFGDREVVRVEGVDLVVERADTERRDRLTTLRAAAEFVGVPVGANTDTFTPVTPAEPDAPLPIDPSAATALAEWNAFAHMRLAEICGLHPDEEPGTRQLWPEHFDLSIDLGDDAGGTRATYGASPGDETIAEPYLYVGPWAASRKTGPLAEYAFGAACTYSTLIASDDAARHALDFFESCAQLVLARAG
jgi:hypothetical protein